MRYIYQVSTVQERYGALVKELKEIKALRVIRHGLRNNWAIFALEDLTDGHKYIQLYKLSKASRYEVAQEAQSEDDYPDFYDVPVIYLDVTENGGQARSETATRWREIVRKYQGVVKALKGYNIPAGARFINEANATAYTYTGEGRSWKNTKTGKVVRFTEDLHQMAKLHVYNAHRGEQFNA